MEREETERIRVIKDDAADARRRERKLERQVRRLERRLNGEESPEAEQSLSLWEALSFQVEPLHATIVDFVHPDGKLQDYLVQLRTRHESLRKMLVQGGANPHVLFMLGKIEQTILNIVASATVKTEH